MKLGTGTFQENGLASYAAYGDTQPTFKRIPHNLYKYELLTDGAATYTMTDRNQDNVFEWKYKVEAGSTTPAQYGPI